MGPNDVVQIVTFQWKAGGWLAVACAAIGGFIQWQRASLFQCLGGYSSDLAGQQICSTAETIDGVAVATLFGAIVVGGCIGVGIALLLLALGVRHDTLGIEQDE
jgi:hypothetical protein